MNKKIKNATVREYDNIKFKSILEVSTYKTLIEYGFKPEYEKHTYVVWTDLFLRYHFILKINLKERIII